MENKPRYAIVRVDNNCPFYTELVTTKCWIYKNDKSCFKCKIKKTYGDTKEQMVLKVAQVIFKAKLERYRQVWKCECSKMEKKGRYKDSLTLAKEIIEFLGVQ